MLHAEEIATLAVIGRCTNEGRYARLTKRENRVLARRLDDLGMAQAWEVGEETRAIMTCNGSAELMRLEREAAARRPLQKAPEKYGSYSGSATAAAVVR